MVTTMRTTAEQVAEYFLLLVDDDAGDVMTNLRLQKLVYYAQAWRLAILDEALFEDDFEAWVHGIASMPSSTSCGSTASTRGTWRRWRAPAAPTRTCSWPRRLSSSIWPMGPARSGASPGGKS